MRKMLFVRCLPAALVLWVVCATSAMAAEQGINLKNLKVIAVPVGSAEEFGGTSDFLYLEPGAYTLEFRAPGFLAKTLRLKVSGEPIVVSLALEADPEAVGEQASPAPSPGLPYGRRFGPDFGSATGSTEAPAGLTGPAA